MSDVEKSQHFISALIAADLANGRFDRPVKTRFPPEPNGYLHIGHAKAICLSFGMAAEYGGTCNLRFDDTNPETEDPEFVDAIQADIEWLGFHPAEVRYASDYFEQFYELAQLLVREGRAYVCDLSDTEIREYRGTVTEPGRPSPWRDRSPAENLDLLDRMRAGEFPDGAKTLRFKGDMASSNMKMRDPLLYRIRHAHHYRRGDDWSIYPMYDWGHCLGDAIEDVTHSLCTLEFQDNRELYDVFLAATHWDQPPYQTEFARLELTTVVTSKRKLKRLVHEGHVAGWDDPRMPTLAGLRRRGVPAAAIRDFCDRVGVAKANSTVDYAHFEACIRDDLNHEAPRVMAVSDPLPLVVDSYPADQVEWLDAPSWPHDVPKEGTRPVPFSRELLIERSDFEEHPSKGFKRMAPGRTVRLRYGYVVTCTSVDRDAAGNVVAVHCTHDPATRGGTSPAPRGSGPEDRTKVWATIHWVSAGQALRAEIRLYDRLFAVDAPGAERDIVEDLNPDSLRIARGLVEPSVGDAPAETRLQFERLGYFWPDPTDSRPGALVFNRIVALKDSWKRREATQAPAPVEAPTEPTTQPAELPPEPTEFVATDPILAAFLAQALAVHDDERAITNWLANDLRAALKDRDAADLPFDGAAIGRLVALLGADAISSSGAQKVWAELLERGGDPTEIVARLGLAQLSDEAALAAVVDEVLSAHPDEVARYRGGRSNLLGFFVGAVMKATRGRANPQVATSLLKARLEAP